MKVFRHNEQCMGTVFQYFGRSDLPETELQKAIQESVSILHKADEIFSMYKPESPLSQLARGETSLDKLPEVVSFIWDECDRWEELTEGWFSAMTEKNTFDPSGLVKSWATEQAGLKLEELGVTDFAINAGGDIRLAKTITEGMPKRIGIAKPISIVDKDSGAITVLDLNNTDYFAVATSGTAERGEHIWIPKDKAQEENPIIQVTVVAKDIITADVFATAVFAAGANADRLLTKHEDILQALVILKNGENYSTKDFVKLISPV